MAAKEDLEFFPDFFTEEDKQLKAGAVLNFAATKYGTEYDEDELSSTSEEESVPSKRSRTTNNKGGLSPVEKKERRKERNRIGARNTRNKKKLYVENLQREIARITDENELLTSKLVSFNHEFNLEPIKITQSSSSNETEGTTTESQSPVKSMNKYLESSNRAYYITDPSKQEHPIVFASRGLLTQTGYHLSEVLGRNCRFLQGIGSDPKTMDKMDNSIDAGQSVSLKLLNFRKNHSPYFATFLVSPLREPKGRLVNFVSTLVEEVGSPKNK